MTVGLVNLGNTCYLNSLLQCFMACKGIKKSNLEQKLGVSRDFSKILNESRNDENGIVISPVSFLKSLQEFNQLFNGFQQQDSHEAYLTIVNELDKVSKNLFYGEYKCVMKCEKCKYRSVTNQPFCDFVLALKGGHKQHLRELITKMVDPETLVWTCELCKNPQGKKYTGIKKFPKNLVIQLNRFYNGTLSKNNEFVDFDESMTFVNETGKYKYKLTGIVNHMGNVSGGHYTAYTLDPVSSNWVLCNDAFVCQIPENKVDKRHAYLLFYEQIE